jgi:1-acyl-sn-glycerol-3-phosphate acyltransferase
MQPTRLQALSGWLLGRFGWQVELVPPQASKFVLVFYPHTSNWDFVVGMLARASIWLPVHFAGKDSLFRAPFGWFFRWLGGIPVNRREHTGFISRLTREFAERKRFYLAIAPEGTRAHTDHWKSGFYRLALAAKVPLALAYIDYRRKSIGIGAYLEMTGNEERDLQAIRDFYSDKTGRWPENQGEIRFTRSS